jgi:DNA polymerase-3 subunit epsilon/oligoribonuclease
MLGIFLDQETTGLDSYIHKVLEVACVVVNLSTGQKLASFQSVVKQSEKSWQECDRAALLVNGFSWDEVQEGRPQEDVGKEIMALFQNLNVTRGKAVFICQNPSFDRAFFSHLVDTYTQEKLNWPYHWLDLASMYWALEIEKTKALEAHLPDEVWLSKDHIASSFGLPKESKPHRAMQGVEHLILCYSHVVGFPQ